MASLAKIEGIGERYADRLKTVGIKSIEDLLEKGGSPAGRKQLEEQTGIDHKLVLEWVNHADLFRIKGVGEEYSDLLEEAGVDTVAELARRDCDNLHQKLMLINQENKLCRRPPTAAMVEDWIRQAKELPRLITY